MRRSGLLGLWLIALTFMIRLTVSSQLFSDAVIDLDLLPDFLGFILLYLGIEKLRYDSPALRACGKAAVALSAVSFVTFLAQLSPYYITALATVSDDGRLVGPTSLLANALRIVFGLFDGAHDLFFAVYMLFLGLVCLAMMHEIKSRTALAPDFRKFSQKNRYGERVYSRLAHRVMTALSALAAVVFVAQAAVYAADQWLHFDVVTLLGIRAPLWAALLPVNLLFAVYANTAVQMIADPPGVDDDADDDADGGADAKPEPRHAG